MSEKEKKEMMAMTAKYTAQKEPCTLISLLFNVQQLCLGLNQHNTVDMKILKLKHTQVQFTSWLCPNVPVTKWGKVKTTY